MRVVLAAHAGKDEAVTRENFCVEESDAGQRFDRSGSACCDTLALSVDPYWSEGRAQCTYISIVDVRVVLF